METFIYVLAKIVFTGQQFSKCDSKTFSNSSLARITFIIIQGCICLVCCVDAGADGAQTTVGKELHLSSDQGQAANRTGGCHTLQCENSQFKKRKKHDCECLY